MEKKDLLELYDNTFVTTVEDWEIDVILKQDCNCIECGENILEFYTEPEFIDNTMICYDCFLTKHDKQ